MHYFLANFAEIIRGGTELKNVIETLMLVTQHHSKPLGGRHLLKKEEKHEFLATKALEPTKVSIKNSYEINLRK